jgi:prophage antirepressor-like protein
VNELQIFENGEFEIYVTPMGDAFTVQAPGFARALGHRDANTMLANIPGDEKGYGLARTPGGYQEVAHLTEPGFYRALGQRQLGRIKNPDMRAQVERFQRWLYHDVLPSLRRNGYYSLPSATQALASISEEDMPELLTWKEVCFVIRQDYRVRVHVARLRRTLMAGGVLTQAFEPKAGFTECFWWTGTAHLVYRDAVPRLFFEYQRTERLLGLARGGRRRELVAPQQGDLFGGAS